MGHIMMNRPARPANVSVPSAAPGHRRAARTRPAIRLGGMLAACLLLAACAGETPVPFFQPPATPNVPEAPAGQYPTFTTSEPERKKVLTPEERAKLERELQSLTNSVSQKAAAPSGEANGGQ